MDFDVSAFDNREYVDFTLYAKPSEVLDDFVESLWHADKFLPSVVFHQSAELVKDYLTTNFSVQGFVQGSNALLSRKLWHYRKSYFDCSSGGTPDTHYTDQYFVFGALYRGLERLSVYAHKYFDYDYSYHVMNGNYDESVYNDRSLLIKGVCKRDNVESFANVFLFNPLVFQDVSLTYQFLDCKDHAFDTDYVWFYFANRQLLQSIILDILKEADGTIGYFDLFLTFKHIVLDAVPSHRFLHSSFHVFYLVLTQLILDGVVSVLYDSYGEGCSVFLV